MITALLFPYLLLLTWFIFSIYYLRKAFRDISECNQYLLELIPSTFTTIGVLGTFIGIAVGLQKFNVDNIDESIPMLLSGLKTAFFTSITGIVLSIIFSKTLALLKGKEENVTKYISGEEAALNKIIEQNDELIELIAGEGDRSLASHMLKLRQAYRDENGKTNESLSIIQDAIGGGEDSSLLSQISKMREENYEGSQVSVKKLDLINDSSIKNSEIMDTKFTEFAELLEKSNTEALVKAIENVIGGFNDRLNELIERLVKENFEELNQSVQALNEWQQENKVMIAKLTEQFLSVSSDIQQTSEALTNITESSAKLIGDSGQLSKLIAELESVMVENTLFKDSVVLLKESTEIIESSSATLHEWLANEKDLSSSVTELIDKLNEIQKLREDTDGFFTDIKKHMLEGVDVVKEGNSQLMANIESIEESFNERMNTSFRSLDKILQAMVIEYSERLTPKT
jgi:hypothetical protein